MSRAPIDIGELPGELRRREAAIKAAIALGIRNGMRRGRTTLVLRTPKDNGLLRQGWKTTPEAHHVGGSGIIGEIFNSSPYAGIVEEGARPHPVSAEGRLAIYTWVRRHFPQEDEAGWRSITFLICRKIRKKGQKPTYFVRNSRPELARQMVEEILYSVQRVADRPRIPK